LLAVEGLQDCRRSHASSQSGYIAMHTELQDELARSRVEVTKTLVTKVQTASISHSNRRQTVHTASHVFTCVEPAGDIRSLSFLLLRSNLIHTQYHISTYQSLKPSCSKAFEQSTMRTSSAFILLALLATPAITLAAPAPAPVKPEVRPLGTFPLQARQGICNLNYCQGLIDKCFTSCASLTDGEW